MVKFCAIASNYNTIIGNCLSCPAPIKFPSYTRTIFSGTMMQIALLFSFMVGAIMADTDGTFLSDRFLLLKLFYMLIYFTKA